MHDTRLAATNLRLINVSGTHKVDLRHVRLKTNRLTIPLQFTDYISHFGGSTLPSYGHKTEGISRVLVADGIEVLLDQ